MTELYTAARAGKKFLCVGVPKRILLSRIEKELETLPKEVSMPIDILRVQ